MLITKTQFYMVGTCSITGIIGKEKKLAFDNGEEIEVTKEQSEKINKDWFTEIKEVKDGNRISK